jgi:hypothetical protein
MTEAMRGVFLLFGQDGVVRKRIVKPPNEELIADQVCLGQGTSAV